MLEFVALCSKTIVLLPPSDDWIRLIGFQQKHVSTTWCFIDSHGQYTVTTIYVSNWTRRYQKYNGRGKGRVATLGSGLGQVGDWSYCQSMQGFLWQKLYKKVQGVSRNSTWFNTASLVASSLIGWRWCLRVCEAKYWRRHIMWYWCNARKSQENNEYCQILPYGFSSCLRPPSGAGTWAKDFSNHGWIHVQGCQGWHREI